MTITILKRKFHTEPTYVKVASMSSRRKLVHESLIPNESQSRLTKNVSPVEYTPHAHPFSCYGQQNSSSSNIYQTSSSCRKKGGSARHHDKQLDSSQRALTGHIKAKHVLNVITEGHGTTRMHENLNEKWEMMNASKLKQCSGILKKLMTHQFGWVFNQPVDPLKLEIPDYFSIITKPMDLGTVKHKLENMQYKYTAQFVADVRLTFANAMRYNPPCNDVHNIAKKLNNIFNIGWKSLEGYEVQKLQKLRNETNKKTQNPKGLVQGKASNAPVSSAQKPFTPMEAKDLKIGGGKNGSEYMHKGTSNLNFNDLFDEFPQDLERSVESVRTCSARGSNILYREGVGVDNCDTYSDGNKGPSSEEQLSPSRALRAATLKSRFTETIFKAQQKTLLHHGDYAKMQKERSRLEKKHQEERARIEAQIKAAETLKMEKEAALILQREKAREAARLALQSMEKTVDIDENCGLLRDLQSLGYSEPPETFKEMMSFRDSIDLPVGSGNPLERLGLFVKNDDVDVDIDEWISATGEGMIAPD